MVYDFWVIWYLLGYAEECFGFIGVLARRVWKASKFVGLEGCTSLPGENVMVAVLRILKGILWS